LGGRRIEVKAEAGNGEFVSFNTRRIIVLVGVSLASALSGWYTLTLTDSQMAAILGVVGIVVVVLWASRRT
jgi:hypothetical protein